jgi:hypothetical protein
MSEAALSEIAQTRRRKPIIQIAAPFRKFNVQKRSRKVTRKKRKISFSNGPKLKQKRLDDYVSQPEVDDLEQSIALLRRVFQTHDTSFKDTILVPKVSIVHDISRSIDFATTLPSGVSFHPLSYIAKGFLQILLQQSYEDFQEFHTRAISLFGITFNVEVLYGDPEMLQSVFNHLLEKFILSVSIMRYSVNVTNTIILYNQCWKYLRFVSYFLNGVYKWGKFQASLQQVRDMVAFVIRNIQARISKYRLLEGFAGTKLNMCYHSNIWDQHFNLRILTRWYVIEWIYIIDSVKCEESQRLTSELETFVRDLLSLGFPQLGQDICDKSVSDIAAEIWVLLVHFLRAVHSNGLVTKTFWDLFNAQVEIFAQVVIKEQVQHLEHGDQEHSEIRSIYEAELVWKCLDVVLPLYNQFNDCGTSCQVSSGLESNWALIERIIPRYASFVDCLNDWKLEILKEIIPRAQQLVTVWKWQVQPRIILEFHRWFASRGYNHIEQDSTLDENDTLLMTSILINNGSLPPSSQPCFFYFLEFIRIALNRLVAECNNGANKVAVKTVRSIVSRLLPGSRIVYQKISQTPWNLVSLANVLAIQVILSCNIPHFAYPNLDSCTLDILDFHQSDIEAKRILLSVTLMLMRSYIMKDRHSESLLKRYLDYLYQIFKVYQQDVTRLEHLVEDVAFNASSNIFLEQTLIVNMDDLGKLLADINGPLRDTVTRDILQSSKALCFSKLR